MIVQDVRAPGLASECYKCEGGALPVIMPIIGPRETHDYGEVELLRAGPNLTKHCYS